TTLRSFADREGVAPAARSLRDSRGVRAVQHRPLETRGRPYHGGTAWLDRAASGTSPRYRLGAVHPASGAARLAAGMVWQHQLRVFTSPLPGSGGAVRVRAGPPPVRADADHLHPLVWCGADRLLAAARGTAATAAGCRLC